MRLDFEKCSHSRVSASNFRAFQGRDADTVVSVTS